MTSREDLTRRARRLPDRPGWVDFRGMLLSGACDVHGGARDYVIVSHLHPVCAAVGKPSRELLRKAVRGLRGRVHLVGREGSADHLRKTLRTWKGTPAILHRLSARVPRTRPDPAVRRVGAKDRNLLRAVPQPLRGELARNVPRCVTVAYVLRGKPVSFAYACWETERWFDISVDTLKPYRRRGFAAACVRRLVAEMRRRSKRPVWGAAEDNPASLALAAKLGFRAVDRIWVFSRR